MTSRFKDHILTPDVHANRPAVTAVPPGTLYPCTTHNTLDRSDGAAWATWATLGAGSAGVATGGTAGQLYTKNSGTDFDAGWATLSGTKVINAQTGTSYTAVLADAARSAFLTMTNAATSTFTIPPNSSVAFPVGSVIEGAQLGAGQVILTPGSGVTINGTPGLKVAAQYGTFGLLKTATDTWLAYGRLSA